MQNGTGGPYYANNIGYTPAGGLSTVTLGNTNTVTQNYTWNDRFQPIGMTAKQGATTLLGLGLFPCPTNGTACASASGTGNNGNLLSQTITMPGLSQLTQTYLYDHLNRLTQAQETGGGANWSQTYSYDAVGNRWIVPTQSTGLPALTLETPQAQNWYSTTVANQIASWTYDGNGNVLQEGTLARSFTYDAENRQVTACLNCAPGPPTATYMYDGEGQRVSKTVNGQTTTYVYDAFGNLAAEYGGESTGCGTCYVTTDHLGSTRLLTNSAGGPFSRYDYEPFGQEIGAGYDGRTAPMGFTAMLDAANPKFTGQQRDQETTLDWFNVRYYSGAQGRFQSPDPANAGADPSNPQSWNGYAYVANNPLSYTDPSGMCPSCVLGLLGEAAGGSGVGLAIGAAIGLGELFYDIFGGGGPPPSIPSSLATPSSPILQPSPDFDSQGWNAQIPGNTDPDGSIDSGTLFGSGNTSPFIFSATQGSSPFALDPVGATLQSVGTFSSGAADFMTFGVTKKINQWDGGAVSIDYKSGTYTAGKVTGIGLTVLSTVAGGLTAGALREGKIVGGIFGRGGPIRGGLLNRGVVRFGWGWEGSATAGRDVIRLGIGAARGTNWWSHIPIWYP